MTEELKQPDHDRGKLFGQAYISERITSACALLKGGDSNVESNASARSYLLLFLNLFGINNKPSTICPSEARLQPDPVSTMPLQKRRHPGEQRIAFDPGSYTQNSSQRLPRADSGAPVCHHTDCSLPLAYLISSAGYPFLVRQCIADRPAVTSMAYERRP